MVVLEEDLFALDDELPMKNNLRRLSEPFNWHSAPATDSLHYGKWCGAETNNNLFDRNSKLHSSSIKLHRNFFKNRYL